MDSAAPPSEPHDVREVDAHRTTHEVWAVSDTLTNLDVMTGHDSIHDHHVELNAVSDAVFNVLYANSSTVAKCV